MDFLKSDGRCDSRLWGGCRVGFIRCTSEAGYLSEPGFIRFQGFRDFHKSGGQCDSRLAPTLKLRRHAVGAGAGGVYAPCINGELFV